MPAYKIKLQYRGTGYFGWQVQKGNFPTIQSELNKALFSICKSDEFRSQASGRTDAGVHSIGQIVRVDLPLCIPPERLIKAINAYLPPAIRVTEADNAEESFHPIKDAYWKEYIYVFTMEDNISPFISDLVVSYPYALDLELMRQGAKLFIGEHDFANFYCLGTDISTSVREIYWADVEHVKTLPMNPIINNCFVMHIRGNGLLKQMARLIMGSIWNLGRGKITLEQLSDAINCRTSGKLAAVAPPHGLYLKEVSYSPLID